MVHDPHMDFGRIDRQTMTSYSQPMRRRADSEMRTSLGWWSAVSDLVGFTLVDCLISPVAGLAVVFVFSGLVVFGAASDLFNYAIDALGSRARKTKT